MSLSEVSHSLQGTTNYFLLTGHIVILQHWSWLEGVDGEDWEGRDPVSMLFAVLSDCW